MKKRKIVLDILMVLLFIIGIGAIAYPFVSDSVNHYLNQQIINYYQNKANEENFAQMSEVQAEMERLNQELAEREVQTIGNDPFSKEAETEVVPVMPQDYYEQNTIGVLTIPKINVNMPIFNETTAIFLERGATLLDGTSYPTGGMNTHSVITSHAGLTNAKLFTDLEKMVEGDQFFIDINNRTLAYEVDQIKVVLPTELDDVKIVEGEDYLTLLTCTPYMINSHRLLIRGKRVPYVEEVVDEKVKVASHIRIRVILWGVGVALFVGAAIFLLYKTVKNYLIANRTYGFEGRLLDDNSEPIRELPLQLFNQKMKPIRNENQTAWIVETDADGVFAIRNLPGGKYILHNDERDIKVAIFVKKVKDEDFALKKISAEHFSIDVMDENE